MKRRWLTGLAITAAFGGCGGNYSNEDVDFQLAMPERDELTVKLPNQALIIDPTLSSEYYLLTRKVTVTFNGIVDAFLGLIDAVRSYPPTERKPGMRIWGPFPNEGHRDWLLRVVIARRSDVKLASFEYSVEFRRRADPSAPWAAIIDGTYSLVGGALGGTGVMNYRTAAARAAGYPLGDDLKEIDSITIDYDRLGHPSKVNLFLTSHPSNEKLTYQYTEETDGSGTLLFTFPTTPDEVAKGVAEVSVRSRWIGSGAGRADVTVTKGTILMKGGARGVDCWGTDTRKTYVFRSWEGGDVLFGYESACVFGPP